MSPSAPLVADMPDGRSLERQRMFRGLFDPWSFEPLAADLDVSRPAGVMAFDRRMILLGGLALAGCKMSGGGANGPVRVIAPLGVGSTGDTVARRLVVSLAKTLGRPMYVENIPGAGGLIGTEQLVKAPKDGSTIGIVSSNHVTNKGVYKSMPFDPIKDITPLAIIGDSPQVLMINPSIPVHNVQELIAYVRTKPGALHYGSSGIGTTLHLLGVKLAKSAGIDIVHVPYKGTAPMLSDLLGGQVQMAFLATTQAASYIRQGKVRAIGVTSNQRSRILPDIPTFAEQGLKDFDLSTWMALIGPAGMDPALVDKLNQAINRTLQMADVVKWFHDQDWRIATKTPAEAKAFFETEQDKYLKLVQESGATPQ